MNFKRDLQYTKKNQRRKQNTQKKKMSRRRGNERGNGRISVSECVRARAADLRVGVSCPNKFPTDFCGLDCANVH